ncbi:LVIVD repeat-containing protein [Natrononativus amylolyticus]|uniref:LVIVD repeat-containing protein n=1 Tax=Natrononativus amylolyticus TaxID=2963434 RepID=UPI0020CC20D9|nr:regulatory P domain-containing protein [Natrononativus amylolyticus]
MHRRQFLAASSSGLAVAPVLGGCLGDSGTDDDAPAGRLEPLGHELGDDSPMYTYGHVSRDGQWGILGGFPSAGSTVTSTLVDLSDLEEPTAAHRLESSNEATRSNDVKFDALREGVYYRSQEANDDSGLQGIEVVDFGWDAGTPDSPETIGRLETPNTGVHRLTAHPEEPVLYLVDLHPETDVGVLTVDVSEPATPELVDAVGPAGACHDVEYDPARNLLHAAYIMGPNEGYVIYDLENPLHPTVHGQFRYAEHPEYTEIGEPGFERCHQAHPDPDRELAIIGDETEVGVPGGKHVFDIGWDEGSLEEPEPIGFTHAPDAREMDQTEAFWWTAHFHDVVHTDGEALLVDGGYRQGAWVCNLTEPREPVATERYATTDGADRAPDHSTDTPAPASPPFAWSAVYNREREFVFVSDSVTGAYTFELSAAPARGDDGGGPDGHYDVDD